MKRKLLAGMLGLFLMIRLVPAVSIFWAERISLPLLGLLARMGGLFPFALLEWGLGGMSALLLTGLLQRKRLKFLSFAILAALLCCLAVWYPLYFRPQPVYTAGNEAISRLCERLIDEANAYEGAYTPPADLPAKFIRFPEWMGWVSRAFVPS